jgi:hypothetical protein
MAKKLSTTRKGLAIGLAVVGIAGLSLASAAQLNLVGPVNGTLQAGSIATVNADCQSANIPVTFSAPVRSGADYKSQSIDLKNIDAKCSGKSYKLTVLTASNTIVSGLSEASGSIATATAPGTSALAVNISALDTAAIDSIKTVSLTIYS